MPCGAVKTVNRSLKHPHSLEAHMEFYLCRRVAVTPPMLWPICVHVYIYIYIYIYIHVHIYMVWVAVILMLCCLSSATNKLKRRPARAPSASYLPCDMTGSLLTLASSSRPNTTTVLLEQGPLAGCTKSCSA